MMDNNLQVLIYTDLHRFVQVSLSLSLSHIYIYIYIYKSAGNNDSPPYKFGYKFYHTFSNLVKH